MLEKKNPFEESSLSEIHFLDISVCFQDAPDFDFSVFGVCARVAVGRREQESVTGVGYTFFYLFFLKVIAQVSLSRRPIEDDLIVHFVDATTVAAIGECRRYCWVSCFSGCWVLCSLKFLLIIGYFSK